MNELKFEPKESVISALSWTAYGGTLLITGKTDAADAAKSAVESIGGIVSIQEKDSISKKVSGFCKEAWKIVLKQYGAKSLKSELQNYNFASDPFHWDNALTIQARIIAACKKKKINVVKVPFKQISESVVKQLSKMMDDDLTLKQLFLLVDLSKDKRHQRKESAPVSETVETLTFIPPPSELIGRNKAVSEIREMLRSSDIVCIHADGGVGKTAVAAVVMDQIRKDSDFEDFAWITSSGSLKKDLALLKVPAAANMQTDEEKLNAVVSFLQKHPTFIVIDNMDSLPEKDDRSLLNTIKRKTKVLVTSRIALRNMKPYGLGKLDPEPALEYFYRCYLDEYGHAFVELSAREDAEYVRHIIEAAAYNALLIELIGGLARWEFRGKLGDLWEKLKDNIFSATSKVELENEHSASHGLSKEDLKLQNQISRLYALSSLSEGCRKIMNFMARFPAEMSVFDALLDWAGFDINDLKWLTDRAWIEQTQEGYLLHTMVRGSVLKQEIEFDIWEYGNLIDKLGYTENYIPVKAGYVTVRKRLDTVSILGGLLSDSLEAKLEDVEDYRRMHIYGAFLNNLSGVYYSQGNYEEALKYYGKALQIYKKVLEEEHPDIAAIYNNLAVVYYCQGNYEEALKNYGKALEIKEKVLGEEHLDTAATYNNLAGVYGAQRKYDEALRYYTKALEIRKKYLGEEYPDTASIYNNLAGVYSSQGNYEEALKYYEKALKIREKVLRKEHPDIAATYNNLALIYQRQRKYEDSLKYYGKALEIQKKVLGEEHPDTATTYFNMGVLFCSLGDPGKAVGYIRKALPIFEKVLGDAHPYTKQARDLLEIVMRNVKT
jgi:tetratricopeptide (TPR) repeat protein